MPAFGRFLAEDNMLADALWPELGARHALWAGVVLMYMNNIDRNVHYKSIIIVVVFVVPCAL
jgi:hypothetical protein